MIKLELMIGHLGDTPFLVRHELAGKSIPQHFHAASSGDIALVSNTSRIELTRRFNANAYSLDLHYALNTLIADAPNGNAIGLLFAGRYGSEHSALGVMFDRGFATSDDPEGGRSDFAVPRQGCAVFLDRIAELRGGYGTPEYADESIYTAIHELGHVFNLVHRFDEPNFMAGSDKDPRGADYFRFTAADQLWLGICSNDPMVTPGGLPFRDRTGSWSSVAAENGPLTSNVTIEISIARNQVLRFDPVELDIRIHALPKSGKVVIPDEIDPGYPRFRIWIEHPSGERLLYRSPRHYCPSGKTRTLNPGEVFERDVSIFGQSGGYTFSEPGGYTIWAELYISRYVTVRSNDVQIEVLPPGPKWKKQLILAEPGIARLLYYRRASHRSRHLHKLLTYRREFGRDYNAGVIDYAIGRIYANLAKSVKDKSSRNKNVRLASTHLNSAADHPLIGSNARRISRTLVKELRG
jgi:hypothetical protein